MIMMSNFKFIREHGDKEVLDKVQMEFYITLLRLLQEDISQLNQTSSE